MSARVRKTLKIATAVLALLLSAACGGGASTTASPTLRIGYIGTTANLTGALGYLHSKGELVKALSGAGITTIETHNFANGPDLNQALAGGSLDVGIYGDTPALVARGAGQPTRLLGQAGVDLDAAIVTKAGGPASPAELAGRTVAVAKGSYMHRYLLGALQDAQVKPAQILNIPTADTPAALAGGQIDAAALPITNAEVLRAKGLPIIDTLVRDHPNYAGTSVEVATESFLSDHPAFLGAWQSAHSAAVEQAKSNWPDYLAFAHTLAAFPPEIIDATTPQSQLDAEPFTRHGLDLLAGTQQFLLDAGLQAKAVDIDGWIASGTRKPAP
jgi:NitT/TauT family transport system substrate-binding protein/sulfonate transport system substrate-binding protein